jgi:hypothetical protein
VRKQHTNVLAVLKGITLNTSGAKPEVPYRVWIRWRAVSRRPVKTEEPSPLMIGGGPAARISTNKKHELPARCLAECGRKHRMNVQARPGLVKRI